MKIRKSEMTFDVIKNIIIVLICCLLLFPLIYVLNLSFSSLEAVYFGKVNFFPVDFSVEAYTELFKRKDIWIGYWTTFKVLVIGTALSIFCTFGLAYAISRKDFSGRKVITMFCVFTMFFGGGMVPLFLVVQALGLYNTFFALILPSCVGVWNVIVVKTFMMVSVPIELQEAAQIDGAGNFRIYFQIVLPLCKAIIAVIVLFYGVGYWNSFFYPLIFISPSNTRIKPLQIVLREILLMKGGSEGGADALRQNMLAESVKYSSIVVSTVPILMIYPFLAKYLEKGLVMGSIKG